MNNNTGRKRVRRARKNESIKRILLTVCMMAMVAAVSIGGTLAWLTAETTTITNTFTESDIGVTITETEDVDVIGEESFKMIPGSDIAKTVTVASDTTKEDGYLYVEVIEEFDGVTVDEKTYGFADYLTYTVDTTKWTRIGETNVYYLTDGGDSATVLTDNKVTVKTTVTKAMMDALNEDNYPKLIFKAYTIQKANTGDAVAAWTELQNQDYPTVTTD